MVDVIKSLKIEYIYSNPASSFRGLHESLINYGKNTMPEFLTVTHEEASVAMCHGHFKATGKPQMALMHGTVGLQHACMAVYNAWADRVPLILVGGNDLDASKRPPGVPTVHSAQDINALVRDFTKWDDTPVSLQHFSQSFVRAYKYAMTPPYGPVMIALDAGLQQALDQARREGRSTRRNTFRRRRPMPIRLHCARRPSSWSMRKTRSSSRTALARTQKGIDLLVELAELVQVPVVNQQNRVNFPNTHYLSAGPGSVDPQCRRDPGPRAHRLLGHRQRLGRQRRPRRPRHHEIRHKADVKLDAHQQRRAQHQGQLPGLPALSCRSTS